MKHEHFEIIQIDDGGWRIEDTVVRAFLFTGTRRALLVDTGFGEKNIREAVEKITKLPITLVNTHGDGDHIGGNRFFEKTHMHPAEYAYYFENAPADAQVSPLLEGDKIELGSRTFEVILVPGHTPGSIALLDRENRLLVSGDSISAGPIFMFGKIRDIRAYISSMKRLDALRGAFDTICPSHGAFPLEPSLIGALIEGAERVLTGEVEGQEPPMDIPAKLYVSGRAHFFY